MNKISDFLGYILFLVFLLFLSPALIITGGLLRIKRYYLFVKSKVNDQEPKKYTIYY